MDKINWKWRTSQALLRVVWDGMGLYLLKKRFQRKKVFFLEIKYLCFKVKLIGQI